MTKNDLVGICVGGNDISTNHSTKMSTQGVIAALYPLHIAQFLMGCVSIKLPRNNTNFKIINRKMYDYTAFAVIFMMITVYIIYRQHRPEDLDATTLARFINLLYFLIVIGFPLISFFWTNFQKRSTEKLWTDLDKVDTEIKHLGIQLNYNFIKNTSTRFLFLGICNIHLYIIYMVVSQTFVDKLQGGIAYGLQYFAALNHMSVVCSFVTLIRTISHMLEKLTRKFEMMHENSAIRRVLVLRKIMRVYHELYDLHKLVSKIFSVQVLLSFAISFVLLTLQSYNIMCGIYNDTPYFKYSVMALIFVVVITLEKFIITFCCHQCMYRVSWKGF
jgi:hypothetical protein